MEDTQPITVELGEEVVLNEHWSLTSSLVSIAAIDLESVQMNDDPYAAFFSAEQLVTPLLIRPFRAGDRFLPFGMDGSVKVSDYFTNNKIPILAREYWPLLCDEAEILWMVGLRPSNRYRVGNHTREVAKFRLVPLREEDETKV